MTFQNFSSALTSGLNLDRFNSTVDSDLLCRSVRFWVVCRGCSVDFNLSIPMQEIMEGDFAYSDYLARVATRELVERCECWRRVRNNVRTVQLAPLGPVGVFEGRVPDWVGDEYPSSLPSLRSSSVSPTTVQNREPEPEIEIFEVDLAMRVIR